MLDRTREPLAFHRTGLRLLKILHGLDRALVPVLVVDAVTRVAATYANFFLTALLVNSLIALDWRASVASAAAIVAVSAAAGVVTRVCEYHRNDGA